MSISWDVLYNAGIGFKFVAGTKPKSFDGISHVWDPLPQTYCYLKNKKYLNSLGLLSKQTEFKNSYVVIEEKLLDELQNKFQSIWDKILGQFQGVLSTPDVMQSMTDTSILFYQEKFGNLNLFIDGRILGTAQIAPSAMIAQNSFIGDNVIVEDHVSIMPMCSILPGSVIKKNTVIYPGVTIYPFTKIGESCRIHSQSSIGADGFGYHFGNGIHQKIWHFNGVEIGNNVEIGSSSTIDSGAFIPTRIGDGTKIDNGVQVGHNCQIGKHTVLCGQVAVAGSVIIEDYCVLGGMAGISPSAHLKKGAKVAAGSIVSENAIIESNAVVAGHPARDLKEWLKNQAKLNRILKEKD